MRFRRNKGTKTLMQDAAQVGGRIAEESLGVAQTARSELSGLSREVREQASGGLSRARCGTARRLESAAALVDERPARKGRRRKPLVLAALAGVIGWIVLKARSNAPHADDLVDETAETVEDKAGKAEAKAKDAIERSAEATERAAERAKKSVQAQPSVKSGNAASK